MPKRKIIVNIAMSADGYVARTDGDLDWLTRRPAPKGFYGLPKFSRSVDAKILGRKTWHLSFWVVAVLAIGWFLRLKAADPLKIGDRAPDFALPDQTGATVRLGDFRGKKTVVLAFYIKAFTPG